MTDVRTSSMISRAILACGLGLTLTACSGSGEPELLNLRSDGTPDEFGILPTAPLEEPATYAALPPPTPGGTNRVDPRPNSDAVAALGGNPAAVASQSGDGALLAAVGRFGTDPAIRRQLAAEDLEFRRENRGLPLERLLNVTVYFDAYSSQSLDKYREMDRFRAAGIPVASTPPPNPSQ